MEVYHLIAVNSIQKCTLLMLMTSLVPEETMNQNDACEIFLRTLSQWNGAHGTACSPFGPHLSLQLLIKVKGARHYSHPTQTDVNL